MDLRCSSEREGSLGAVVSGGEVSAGMVSIGVVVGRTVGSGGTVLSDGAVVTIVEGEFGSVDSEQPQSIMDAVIHVAIKAENILGFIAFLLTQYKISGSIL